MANKAFPTPYRLIPALLFLLGSAAGGEGFPDSLAKAMARNDLRAASRLIADAPPGIASASAFADLSKKSAHDPALAARLEKLGPLFGMRLARDAAPSAFQAYLGFACDRKLREAERIRLFAALGGNARRFSGAQKDSLKAALKNGLAADDSPALKSALLGQLSRSLYA